MLSKLSIFKDLKKATSEKARMEAFLSAVPCEYCGWTMEGELAYSPDFLTLFGLNSFQDETCLYKALDPSDAAALEGQLGDLREKGESFVLECQTADQKRVLRLSGNRGHAVSDEFSYDVLWIEDISATREQLVEAQEARDAAETNEEIYKSLLDCIDLPIWLQDDKGELVWINESYAKGIGTKSEEIITNQKLLPVPTKKKKDEHKRKNLTELALEALKTKKTVTQQNHIVLSGDRRLMSLHLSPTPGGTQVVGCAIDLTQQEEIENNNKRYQESNELLLEQLHTAIATFDAGQELEFYNTEFATLWDLEDRWLNSAPKLGEIMEQLREHRRLPEQADFKSFKQSWLDMFQSLIDPYEDMMHLPDGRTLRLLFIPKPSGGLIMTFEDVSSELELKSSYNTLVAVQKETLDNLSEAVAVYGGDGRLKLWNPSYANMWQLSPETLDNQPHVSKLVDKKQDYFNPNEWEDIKQKLLNIQLQRKEEHGRLDRIDGTFLDYATIALPDGGVLITYVDVSDKARVQQALEDKNAALEEADRLKLDFLANVSYQLRTPLNAIMGFADILSNQYFGELNERQAEYTSGISDAGDRLLSLIDDILDLATLEAGYLNLKTDTVEVYAMVKHIYSLTQEWARKESIKVELDCNSDIGVIVADERRLKQVLLSLIRNAITFTPEGGKITIQAERGKKDVTIRVNDTGPGIAKENHTRMFKPFEQDGKKNEGAGLGLSLVQNIVELHGGHVELDSDVGKGTTVIITLPHKAKVKEEKAA